MQTATIERTQTKIKASARKRKAAQSTFREWLAEEAVAGRMILATGSGKPKLPVKPKGTVDFWPVYNEVRADRL